MNCTNCGNLLTPEDRFCKNCGTPANNPGPVTNNMMNNSGMPNNQQMNGMGYYPQQMPGNKQNKSVIIAIIVGVVVVALLIVGIILIPKLIDKPGNNGGGGTTDDPSVSVSFKTPGVATTQTYKVDFSGFTFTLPETMDYEIESDTLSIGDKERTWLVQLLLGEGSFDTIKQNKFKIQDNFIQEGFSAKPAELKTINGKEYVTVELGLEGKEIVGAYTKMGPITFAWIACYNQDGTVDYNILNEITPVIASAKYKDPSEGLRDSGTFNFDRNKLSESAKH